MIIFNVLFIIMCNIYKDSHPVQTRPISPIMLNKNTSLYSSGIARYVYLLFIVSVFFKLWPIFITCIWNPGVSALFSLYKVSPVNSPQKGRRRGALMFSLICARINSWVNNGEAGDLRRHRAHYDVIVMIFTWWTMWAEVEKNLPVAFDILGCCRCSTAIKQLN